MAHDHHGEDSDRHDHSHGVKDFGRAFAVGVTLNFTFVVIEIVFGLLSGSLSLAADAGHNFSDVLGLLLSWWAASASKKAPTPKRTYGLKSSSILAALFNAIFLLISLGAIAWEAIRRFQHPTDVNGGTIIWVSLIGIAINVGTALMFISGRKGDLNIRSAFVHMAGDAVISAGVVLAGLALLKTGWVWIDRVVSIVIVVVVVFGTWSLFRESLNLALGAVPSGIEIEKVKAYLEKLPSVVEVHDLHIWAMSTTETALTAHLVRSVPTVSDEVLKQATDELHDKFEIAHATLQFETRGHECKLAPDDVV